MPIRFDNIGIQRKMLKNDSLTFFDMFPQLAKQKRDIAFPFIIYLGNVNNTEYGETPGQVNISDFTTFKKIFTGKDSNLAVWEESTTLVKTSDTTAKRTYKVGRHIDLYRVGKSTTNIITPTNEVINAIQQESQTDISFIFEEQTLTKNDLFKLWIIPTQGTNEFFLINSITEYVDANNPDKIIYSEISFTSLNDKLSSAGQQLEQYVNLGAPGEGYAFPKLINILNSQNIMLDPQRIINRGATEIQIELFGPGVITSFYAMGRRAKQNSMEVVAPRHLLPYKVNTQYSTDLNQKTSAESSYYWLQGAEANAISNYDDWHKNIMNTYDYSAKRNFEGYILTSKEQVESTNDNDKSPLGQDFNIWDSDWIIDMTDFESEKKIIDTRAVPYAEDFITYPDEAQLPELLTLNAIAYNDMEKLPITITESTTWTTKKIPIIGFFLNVLTLGYPLGWKNTTSKIQAKLVSGIIPKALYDFSANQTLVSVEGALAMEIFRADTDDATGGIIGTNAIGSTLNISLTDRIIKEGETKDTVDLGQEGLQGWLFKGNETPGNPALAEGEGYIIDFINFKIIGKCDVKITAYRYGTSIWSGYFQSRSKFTTSIREWSNSIKLSAWEEINNEVATYPAAIPEPDQIGGLYNPITYNTYTTIMSSIFVDTRNSYNPKIITVMFLDLEAIGFTFESFLFIYDKLVYSVGNGVHQFGTAFDDDTIATTNEVDIATFFALENDKKELFNYSILGFGYVGGQSTHWVAGNPTSTTVPTYDINTTQEEVIRVWRSGNQFYYEIEFNESDLDNLPWNTYDINNQPPADGFYLDSTRDTFATAGIDFTFNPVLPASKKRYNTKQRGNKTNGKKQ